MTKRTYVPMTLRCEMFVLNQAIAAACSTETYSLVQSSGGPLYGKAFVCHSCGGHDHGWFLYENKATADSKVNSGEKVFVSVYAADSNTSSNPCKSAEKIARGQVYYGAAAGLPATGLQRFDPVSFLNNGGELVPNSTVNGAIGDATITYIHGS